MWDLHISVGREEGVVKRKAKGSRSPGRGLARWLARERVASIGPLHPLFTDASVKHTVPREISKFHSWSPYYPMACSAWRRAQSLDSWGCWMVNHKLRRQIHILSQFKPEVQNQGAGRLIPSGDWENLQACFQLLVVADSSWLFFTSRYSFSLH